MGVEMSHFVLVKNLISDDVPTERKERKVINFYPLAAAGVVSCSNVDTVNG